MKLSFKVFPKPQLKIKNSRLPKRNSVAMEEKNIIALQTIFIMSMIHKIVGSSMIMYDVPF